MVKFCCACGFFTLEKLHDLWKLHHFPEYFSQQVDTIKLINWRGKISSFSITQITP